jgi:hypothetical protein
MMSFKAAFPDHHNLPFRLTKEETNNPYLVIFEFFTSYHLPDIRLSLKSMAKDSMHEDTIEAKERFTTWEDIDKLVEACYIIFGKMDSKKSNPDNFTELINKSTSFSKIPDCLSLIVPLESDFEHESIFGKPVQLIESAQTDPIYVLSEIFQCNHVSSLIEEINTWKFICLSAEVSEYDDGNQRRQMQIFHAHLLTLVEALSVLFVNHPKDVNQKEACNDQVVNSKKVITDFCRLFPVKYVRRELFDMLYAGIAYSGTWPDSFCEVNVLQTYNLVLCLTEAAAFITTNYDSSLW